MRKVSLFIAMSLDGYIADREGSVDWLTGQDGEAGSMDSYREFIKGIDTVLMGANTYRQLVTELSPDEWVYDGLMTYVITHKEERSSEKIRFVREDPGGLIRKLREEEGKGIWICGGAHIVRQLVDEDLIDLYHITVIPTILGSGIRLFEDGKREIRLRLTDTRTYDGMADLVYVRR